MLKKYPFFFLQEGYNLKKSVSKNTSILVYTNFLILVTTEVVNEKKLFDDEVTHCTEKFQVISNKITNIKSIIANQNIFSER
jgi:hypothetical protein